MNITFKGKRTVKADIYEVADFFVQSDIDKNYFPEIHKDTCGMSQYVRGTHKHIAQVFPDYQVRRQGFGWTTGHSTCIRVPRKDINVNIKGLEVQYKASGDMTEITVQVEFDLAWNLAGILGAYHIHMMITNKLNAFQRDIHANQCDGFAITFA